MKSIRPYITVIADSFHEALASYLLWIVLAALTFVLAVLAPVGLKTQRALELEFRQVRDFPGLIARLDEQAKAPAPSPGKRIWELSSEKFKDAVRDSVAVKKGEDVDWDKARSVVDGLNDLLDERKLYDAEAWPPARLDPAARKLLDQGVEKLSKDDLAYFNRLLIVGAYRSRIAGEDEELHMVYGPWTADWALPFPPDSVETIIKSLLGVVMSLVVGVLGVFGAIIITAPIIPRTFEAGAVNLLMSKPVSRPLLFLAKFSGGCAFILLNATYFVVGIWLILGLRFGLWSGRLLLCIPLFLFLFSIYYCVSAAAGVLWKNPIVSVVVTILFWFVCFVVGQTKAVLEGLLIVPNRLVKVSAADDTLVAVNQAGAFLEWDAEKGDWASIPLKDESSGQRGPSPFGSMVAGPVMNDKRDQFFYLEQPVSGFGFMGGQARLYDAKRSPTWTRGEGIEAPSGSSWLFLDRQGRPIVIAAEGIFRFAAGPDGAKKGTSLFGLKLPFGGQDPFTNVGPEMTLVEPFAAAMDTASGDMALYNNGTLTVLHPNSEGRYERRAAKSISPTASKVAAKSEAKKEEGAKEEEVEEESKPATLAFAGETIVLAFGDGEVLSLDARSLKTRSSHRPSGASEPYVALAAPGGARFAVVFHNGKLWLYDPKANSGRVVAGDASAATFDGNDHLLVAERSTRVTRYSIGEMGAGYMSTDERYYPPTTAFQAAYRYAILPIYTVFPKPGELKNVVDYLLTDQDTASVANPFGQADLRATRIKIDVVTPIWSSLAFVVVMLGLTCLFVRRTDL